MRKRIATFENQQRVRRGLVSTMFPICALGLFLTSGTAEAAPHSEKIDVKAARSAPSFKGGASAAPESSAAASPGVQAAIQRHLNDREYWASQSSQGLQAPNRRHNLRTYFGPSGIQLVDRTAEGREELVSLRVTRFGRDEALTTVGPGEVVTEEDRVEIRRPGLVEWYVNLPEGLEQGFTLDTAPSGTGPVVVELAVSGGTVSLQGGQVTFDTVQGRRLHYGAFKAQDANGRDLIARLELPASDRLRLSVDDTQAVYPIVLDPLITATEDSVFQSNQVAAKLGQAVSGAGDINGDGYGDVIIGAPYFDAGQSDEGAAFVFLGSASGLVANGTPANAHRQLESDSSGALFGQSVSGAGDVNGDGYDDVIVGAPYYSDGQVNEGVAIVFLGSASGIVCGHPPGCANAVIEGQQAGAQLQAVSTAGDVNGDGYDDVIVGALSYDVFVGAVVVPDTGAAFVFLGSGAGIVATGPGDGHQLNAEQAGAFFGQSVANAGDVNGDGFDDVIVGAPFFSNGESQEGVASVFLGSASGIVGQTVVEASALLESDQAFSSLGESVAGVGDVNGDGYADVAVGAPLYSAGESEEGAAFVFLGSAQGVTSGTPSSAQAQLESDQIGAGMGRSVDGAGDVDGDGFADVIVGADTYTESVADGGTAFIFLGSSTGIVGTDPGSAEYQLNANLAASFWGRSVAAAGDVDGDGFADVIVGAPYYGASDAGYALVFLGGSRGIQDGSASTTSQIDIQSDMLPTGPHPVFQNYGGFNFGHSIAAAGDVNGDGYGDIIVGAPEWNLGEGAVFLFLGSADGILCPLCTPSQINASAQISAGGNHGDRIFGHSIGGAGDVNGDGYADVIVGSIYDLQFPPSPPYECGGIGCGEVFIFHGSASGLASGVADVIADSRLSVDVGPVSIHGIPGYSHEFGYGFGQTVHGVGDVNGDGYADVAVGSDPNGYVFHGSPTGVVETGSSSAQTTLAKPLLMMRPFAISGAGDVNGDGYADLITGETDYCAFPNDPNDLNCVNTPPNPGSVTVWPGSASGIDNDPNGVIGSLQGGQSGHDFGRNVAGVGDVNADGFMDVVVSELFGTAYVFLGSAAGIVGTGPANAQASIPGVNCVDAGGAGDVNGDGYADLILCSGSAGRIYNGSSAGIVASAPSGTVTNGASYGPVWPHGVGAGDVNGDGFGDVMINYAVGSAQNLGGGVVVFLGGGDGDGRPVLAKQTKPAGDAVVQAWGHSMDDSSITVRMTATQPAGRGRVKLEVEACPPAVPLGDASCTGHIGATWTDVTATSGGVVLTEQVTGLALDTLYRWRARVLYAPFSVTQPGIVPPPQPAHSPWRRLSAGIEDADIRTGVSDFDSDGVPESVEQAAPNAGDGNADGSPDAQQSNVVSLPDLGGTDYLTLEVTDPNMLGNCESVSGVSVSAEPSGAGADPNFEYPFGILGFTLLCSGPADVKIYFHGSSGLVAPYRKYGPTTPGDVNTLAWYSMPGAVFGTELVDGNTVATVTFSLTDGLLGDATGVDGQIVDPGGAASVDTDGDGVADDEDDFPNDPNETTDTDGDGLGDNAETGTGVYVSPTDTGTQATNADSDGDGISDGDEVSAGSDPNDSNDPVAASVPALSPFALAALAAMLGMVGIRWGRLRIARS